MADSPPTVDPQPIRDTLKRLSNDLRLNQFIVKGLKRKRQENILQGQQIDLQEKQTRRQIEHIKCRVRREMEAHPAIVSKFISGMED